MNLRVRFLVDNEKDNSRCIVNVPWLVKDLRIIEKYVDHPKCVRDNVCLLLF